MRRIPRHFLLTIVLAVVLGAHAVAQDSQVPVVRPGPDAYNSGGVISWDRGAPTFQLIPQGPGARSGRIWVSSSASGLFIEGQLDGPKPVWPATRAELLGADHIEVWLAAEPKLDLPPIGWGNQFGENDLDSAKDCVGLEDSGPGSAPRQEACRSWYEQQVLYRKQFRKLFVRQWLLAGDPLTYRMKYSVEAYASAAMQSITNAISSDAYIPATIAPALHDGVRIAILNTPPDKPGYDFQIVIPYSAFPPVPSLDVSDLWLMVDVFGAAPTGRKMGAFSTTAPNRKWGDPSTFNHVRIERPLRMQLTPCSYPLTQKDVYDKEQPTFVYPVPFGTADGAPVVIDKSIILGNPEGGYLYDPVGASPGEGIDQFFSKATGNGGFVCGPLLAYKNGSVSIKTDKVLHEDSFATKVLPDGWTLVRTGPRADSTTFGSGECGACPRAQLQIYAISPQGEIETALDIYKITLEPDTWAADFQFAPDWSRAAYYSQPSTQSADPAPWKETDYCLSGHSYEPCGVKENVKPPNPPVVKALNDAD